ncbi:condensation domain-containing protein, partial [Pedobacter sp. P351]|uniref:condensation domain-containing protein n=1 Tax=Pedobacter superstes TaxID=3133441 RepID=UPI0030A7523D
FTEQRKPELPVLPLQYADYAIWQRQILQEEVLDKKLGYWKEKLQNVSPLELPADHIRPAVQGIGGAHVYFSIDQNTAEGLKTLSHAHGATLYMTLLSAFKVLLYRYSGKEDICVGTG